MIGWFLAGVGVSSAVGITAALVTDEEMRRVFWHALAAVVLGPAVLLVVYLRRAPTMLSLSPQALERFCGMVGTDMKPAWLLAYGTRGIVLVRRRGSGWNRNNVGPRAEDAAGK